VTDKDAIVNQYAVLKDYIDEQYENLTIKQLSVLRLKAQEVWAVLERRGADRRG
jgi:hypothetical protein